MSSPTRWINQAAALPVKDGQICLVTSSSGRRWVIPKGMLEPGKSSGEIAIQEAWEEAGLVGRLQPTPIGTYQYQKYGGICLVTVFLMVVTEVLDDWPEQTVRKRVWLAPDEAADLLEEPALREMVQQTRREMEVIAMSEPRP
ncbi:MAG TPA: NUDIX hydrolase [Gemmataceae bacterium]|nr:NUDIX hydrolase [Gemmataceae bacterium]